MMYNNKLAMAIKVNGRVLREFGEKVFVPFGSEYTILIKNLNTTRALVNINIDGTLATKSGLIIEAGKDFELERYLKDDLNKGNKFKFIERTQGIEKHRGVGLEDGLIAVDYQFELQMPTYFQVTGGVKYRNHHYFDDYSTMDTNENYRSVLTVPSFESDYSYHSNDTITYSTNNNVIQNDVGITVPGSISEQKFKTTYVNTLELTKHNMIIKLVGETDDNKPVSKPLTVKVKPKCVTCGKMNKATSKFCNSCGTALVILT